MATYSVRFEALTCAIDAQLANGDLATIQFPPPTNLGSFKHFLTMLLDFIDQQESRDSSPFSVFRTDPSFWNATLDVTHLKPPTVGSFNRGLLLAWKKQGRHFHHKPRSQGWSCHIGLTCDGHCQCWCKWDMPINCAPCDDYKSGKIAPSHDGNPRCESGSIASGGASAHCSCDICF